jgi:hypothetical protein
MPLRPRAGTHPILETILDQESSAVALVTLLLRIITARQPLPPKAQLYRPQDAGRAGVLQFVRTAAGELLRGAVRGRAPRAARPAALAALALPACLPAALLAWAPLHRTAPLRASPA